MASVTVSANLTDLESHLGDGPLYMPVGGLITLIKLTDVGRPAYYGWNQSLNRGISERTNWEGETDRYCSLLYYGKDVSSYFTRLLPGLPFHD